MSKRNKYYDIEVKLGIQNIRKIQDARDKYLKKNKFKEFGLVVDYRVCSGDMRIKFIGSSNFIDYKMALREAGLIK